MNSQCKVQSAAITISEANHVRLRNQNKPIRETEQTVGVAKSLIWFILQKKEGTGEHTNTWRDPEEHKLLWWRIELFPWWRKSPAQQLVRWRTSCRRLVDLSQSVMKRRCHQSKYRGFSRKCTPVMSLRDSKMRLEIIKHLYNSGTAFSVQMRWRSTCRKMKRREEFGEEKDLLGVYDKQQDEFRSDTDIFFRPVLQSSVDGAEEWKGKWFRLNLRTLFIYLKVILKSHILSLQHFWCFIFFRVAVYFSGGRRSVFS